MLARLGGGHLHDLAGAALEHHEAVLPQRRALHGVGGGGAGIARGEVEFVGHGGVEMWGELAAGAARKRERRPGAPAAGRAAKGDGRDPTTSPRRGQHDGGAP